MFAIPVPKDFTPQDKYTWTIFANGQFNTIPLRLNQDYVISPFSEIAVGNTPPVIRFEENGTAIQGPIAMLARAPLRNDVVVHAAAVDALGHRRYEVYQRHERAADSGDRPPVTLLWSKYRGPGGVKFDKPNPPAQASGPVSEATGFSGKATTSVTFSEPGDYVLHVTVNDYSGDGGGGFQCCWTTSLIKVSVTP